MDGSGRLVVDVEREKGRKGERGVLEDSRRAVL